MRRDLEGKVVVVTGGLGALGIAVASGAALRGARVVLIDRAGGSTGVLPACLEGCPVLYGVDLTVLAAASDAMSTVANDTGGIDALVNVAGGFRWETLAEGDPVTWDILYSINLKTAVTASKAALPYLSTRPGSRIVNIGAVAGGKAAAGMGPYAAAKSGVLRFTEALSQELRNSDCTVNAVLPGIIDTPQNRKDMPDADVSRWVTPDAVANVVLFLLSSQAGAVTGAAIPVTGRM